MHRDEVKILLDYITNLQQEYETLKSYYMNMVRISNKRLDRYLDYKSRCEKADSLLELKQLRYLNEDSYRICTLDLQEVRDILQNGSDSQ